MNRWDKMGDMGRLRALLSQHDGKLPTIFTKKEWEAQKKATGRGPCAATWQAAATKPPKQQSRAAE